MSNFYRANRITRVFSCYLLKIVLCLSTVYALFASMYSTYQESRDPNQPFKWILPFNITMPYDTQWPFGYLVGFFHQVVSILSTAVHLFVVDVIYVGGIIFAMAYVNDLKEYYMYLDEEFLRSHNSRKLRLHLIEAIRKHLQYNEWFEHFSKITSGFIFYEIVGCALSTSTSIVLFLVSVRKKTQTNVAT